MKRIPYIIACAFLIAACGPQDDGLNKFSDEVLVKIADLKDRRLSDSLYVFFNHEEAQYRKEAVLAFASIQDSSAVEKLADVLLNDADTIVRRAAAFSIGQTRSLRSPRVLLNAYEKEDDVTILNEILEAYGKTTRQWQRPPNKENTEEGFAWSLYRAGLNNATTGTENELAADLLASDQNENTRLAAAQYFSRSAKEIDAHLSLLAKTALGDNNVDVRMAAASALRKIASDSSLMTIEKIIQSDDDYRVKISAVRALQNFPFEKSRDHLFDVLNDKNINVGIAAAEVIVESAGESDWIELANRVTNIKDWRIQANLYRAVLRVKDNKAVIDELKSVYSKSTNPYQKAALLTALGEVPSSYSFVENEMSAADTAVVQSSAAAALVAINRNEKFPEAWSNRFAEIYVKAINTGDAAVIGIVAGALTDAGLGYKNTIKDYSFLTTAKRKLSLPKDNEALQPLEEAIAFFEGREAAPVKNEYNHPIDWELVKTIAKDEEAIIKTPKGNITLRLLVEESPGSVANFVTLARAKYFDGKLFHRVVPNFVVQAGCNRGDGWGSEDYSIRSEFDFRKYKTGSVGMASAGKDTEGTQWFITHSSTPHLDGRYTIFAVVENGMEAVHRLEVGDEILGVEFPGIEARETK